MQIGKITVGTIDDWAPTPGVVISWHPTSAAVGNARLAPVSDVPVSYMQAQHIRGVYEQDAAGLDYSRQIIATCEVPGQCDIAAMTPIEAGLNTQVTATSSGAASPIPPTLSSSPSTRVR